MAEDTGAAPAAAESAPAPEVAAVSPPNPIEVAPQSETEASVGKPEKAEPGKPPSIRDALDKAEKTVEAKSKPEPKPEPKTEAKPEVKAEKAEPAKEAKDDNRDPTTGKFTPKAGAEKPADATKPADASKPSHTAEDAPARFTDTAKAKWASADPEIRGETLRMQRELTQGFEKHRAAAERDGTLAEFHEQATKSGTTVKDALSRYVGMENKLRGDLVGGLEDIISNATQGKYSLRDIAAHVMGQKPEEVQSQSDATIRELKQTVARLEQQVGGVSQTIEQQKAAEQQRLQTETTDKVTKWAADKPLFEVLAPHIAEAMRGMEKPDLDEAYSAVLQKHPQLAALAVPGKDAEASSASSAAADLAEQIRKGSKSPTGAPSPGSDPAARKPSKSIRESLDRAFEARA